MRRNKKILIVVLPTIALIAIAVFIFLKQPSHATLAFWNYTDKNIKIVKVIDANNRTVLKVEHISKAETNKYFSAKSTSGWLGLRVSNQEKEYSIMVTFEDGTTLNTKTIYGGTEYVENRYTVIHVIKNDAIDINYKVQDL